MLAIHARGDGTRTAPVADVVRTLCLTLLVLICSPAAACQPDAEPPGPVEPLTPKAGGTFGGEETATHVTSEESR